MSRIVTRFLLFTGQQEEEMMAGTSGSRAARKTRTLQDLFRPPVDITYKGNLANVSMYLL